MQSWPWDVWCTLYSCVDQMCINGATQLQYTECLCSRAAQTGLVFYATLYAILYATLYAILNATLYAILYAILYATLYATLYAVLYAILHAVLYATLYAIPGIATLRIGSYTRKNTAIWIIFA